MEIKTISVTYDRKFNLGDYNSAHIACTLWAELEEGEQVQDCESVLWEEAKRQVKEQATPLYKKQSVEVEQIFAGLPVELRGKIIQQQNGAHHAN